MTYLNLDKVSAEHLLQIIDSFIFSVLAHRLRVSKQRGGHSKRDGLDKGQEDRNTLAMETAELQRFRSLAVASGLHPSYVESVFYGLYREADRMRRLSPLSNPGPMHPSIQDEPAVIREKLRANLLSLTRDIADTYDAEYAQNAVATAISISFEREKIRKIAAEAARLREDGKAYDLGCATGSVARLLCDYFADVTGVDISPHMIERAKDLAPKTAHSLRFVVRDLDDGLDLAPNTASMIVMNMGTASDIMSLDTLLMSISGALIPEGRFFLSFYNSDALMYRVLLPWKPPLEAYYNTEYEYLDVRRHAIFARRYAKTDIEKQLEAAKLEPREWYSYPTIASILPNEALSSEELREAIKLADAVLSSAMNGVYICVSGTKGAA